MSKAWDNAEMVQPGGRFYHAQEQQASGTAGGALTLGWAARDVNTDLFTSSFASRSGSQITLQPGTYKVSATAVLSQCEGARLGLYNVTDDTYDVMGVNQFIYVNNMVSCISMRGVFSISSAKTFELRTYVGIAAGSKGSAISEGSHPEIYSDILIEKVD